MQQRWPDESLQQAAGSDRLKRSIVHEGITMTRVGVVAVLILFAATAPAEEPAKVPPESVELIGKARNFQFIRDWSSYYWREDFTFLLTDEKTRKTWRILSREPTPAYHFRMGTTYTGVKPDWKAQPRVKVFGVTGIDRIPKTFYKLKLDEPNLATAFVVWVETKPDFWQEYYVNNWFHHWSDRADKAVHARYAGRKAPYDVYGFINGQSAPFGKEAQALITKHKEARMFHGLIRATRDNPFGYEIELLHLVGPDKGGNGVVFHGDPRTMPVLDQKK
jgi:hypothetical protein